MPGRRTLARRFLRHLLFAVPPLLALHLGTAAAADKTLQIGILSSGSVDNRSGLEAEFLQGLRDHGYVEGKNLVVTRRYAGAHPENVPQYARQLAGMKLDAIVTTCSPSTWAAKQATTSTPIVMAAVSDPVGQNLIASLSKPGQNVTGLSSQADELLAKRLELLALIVPKATTVAVLGSAKNPVHAKAWARLEEPARRRNIKLLRLLVGTGAELAAAFDSAGRAGAGALLVLPDDPLMYNLRARIPELAAKHRLPDMHWASDFVDVGGLMSYGESLRSSYRSAAEYVSKVANGANPAALPVTQPTRFELAVNLKAAKALGIAIPQDVLLRADTVLP